MGQAVREQPGASPETPGDPPGRPQGPPWLPQVPPKSPKGAPRVARRHPKAGKSAPKVRKSRTKRSPERLANRFRWKRRSATDFRAIFGRFSMNIATAIELRFARAPATSGQKQKEATSNPRFPVKTQPRTRRGGWWRLGRGIATSCRPPCGRSPSVGRRSWAARRGDFRMTKTLATEMCLYCI